MENASERFDMDTVAGKDGESVIFALAFSRFSTLTLRLSSS